MLPPSAFEWDEAKRRSNLAKHGLDFVAARRISKAPYGSGRTGVAIMGKIDSRPSAASRAASSSSPSRGAGKSVASSKPASRAAKSDHSIKPSLPESDQTDWARLDAITDAQIEAAIADDPDAAPMADEAWFASAELVLPEPKRQTTLRLDADLLDWYRAAGPGWQTRMNAVLRGYMEAQRRKKR